MEPPKFSKRGYVKPNYRGKKGKIVNPRSIKRRDPIGGDKEAFMDMGLNNLFAVVISDGSALLVKGGSIKSEYYWWKRRS
ncbi:MAG: hypothetical protein RQ885_03025 [Desulfurococcales archaeon]|nr:hypothetical protein [Desulfurococcales archaeon]